MSNNQTVSAVDEVDSPKNQYYNAYYYATGNKIPNTEDVDYSMTNPLGDIIAALKGGSKYGVINPMFMFMALDAYAGMYSAQSLTSTVQAQKYAQVLSKGFSDIDSALTAIEKAFASGADDATIESLTDNLYDAYAQLAVDLYGDDYVIPGSQDRDGGGATTGKTTTIGNGAGIIADSANYFPLNTDGLPSASLQDFTDVLNQSQVQLSAFSSLSNGPMTGIIEYANGDPTYLQSWVKEVGEISQNYVNGDYDDEDNKPDNQLDLLLNGSITVSENENNPVGGIAGGTGPITQNMLSEYMTSLSSTIKSDQSILDQLYKTEATAQDSASKELLTYVQNQKMQ